MSEGRHLGRSEAGLEGGRGWRPAGLQRLEGSWGGRAATPPRRRARTLTKVCSVHEVELTTSTPAITESKTTACPRVHA